MLKITISLLLFLTGCGYSGVELGKYTLDQLSYSCSKGFGEYVINAKIYFFEKWF